MFCPFFLLVFCGLFCVGLTQDCNETGLILYSVTSFNNVTEELQNPIINITTTPEINTYFVTFSQPYIFNEIWIQPLFESTMTMTNNDTQIYFTIELNGYVFSDLNGPIYYLFPNNNTTPVNVLLTPFYAQGTLTINNTLLITFFEMNISNNTILCEHTDTFTINNPNGNINGGQVIGDPFFVGLKKQKFHVHGISNSIYNLISDEFLQLNARFIFLTTSMANISHDGNYLGELGILITINKTFSIKLHISTQSREKGFAPIEMMMMMDPIGKQDVRFDINRKEYQTWMQESNQLEFPLSGSIEFRDSHHIYIEASFFQIEIENMDSYLNINSIWIREYYREKINSRGLIGQTWQESATIQKESVDQYVVNDLYTIFS